VAHDLALVEWLRALRPALTFDREMSEHLDSIVTWPGQVERFARALLPLLPDRGAVGLDALESIHLADLSLAMAVAGGDKEALRAFQQSYAPVIARAISTVRGSESIAADVGQQVLARVLGARESGIAAIASFGGRSSLIVWLRVIAVRDAVRMIRTGPREVAIEDDQIAVILSPEYDPELAYMKRHYREVFQVAFREALARLSNELRTLLRQSIVDGLGIDRLATLYGIHRATAARRIEAARHELVTATREILGARLRVDAHEIDSILRLIESRLEITLGSLTPRRRRAQLTRS